MKNNLNIRLMIKPLILILGVLSILLGDSTPRASQDVFLFCLKPDVPTLTINRENNQLSIDNRQLDNFFIEKGIENVEEWIPGATEIDKDGDVYLNRIYRAYVSENSRANIGSIISDIEELSLVLYAENEFLRKPLYLPNDPAASSIQCSLTSVKAKQAWDFWDIPNGIIPDGSHVLLASVDTGVDYTHPDLQNNSWINQGEIPSWMFEAGVDENLDGIIEAAEAVAFLQNDNYDVNGDGEINLRDAVSDGSPFEDDVDNDGNGYTDDILGWDSSGYYGPDDNDPYPKEGVVDGTWSHGTHVAGILAATTDNSLGMASTAYNAKYISVKVSRDNQTGEPGINDGYAGITYAAKAGMYAGSFAIINNSWGGGGYSTSENTVINNAQDTYGAIILSSAGNGYDSGGEQYGTGYPASYDNCISVCAIGCSYTWGNWATYHPTVDLAAPGENIYSAVVGYEYESWDGSSMACPNAASAIGLLSAYHPTWNNLELRERIEESADRKIYEINTEYETCNGYTGEDCLGKGMVDAYKAIGMDFSPNLSIKSQVVSPFVENDPATLIDSDNVLNPGESATVSIEIENEIGWVDATQATATLTTDNEHVAIIDGSGVYGTISNNQSEIEDFQIAVSDMIDLGDVVFNLDVTASGNDGYDYQTDLEFKIEVTLFQDGFPYDINAEVKGSQIVNDLDNDGDNELVFGDKFGIVHVIKDGAEIEDNNFPFDTGDEIWGSISSGDLDLDGYPDFVVSSKSGFLYVFDINGLKFSYNADYYLIATPVIGNIDNDAELEIVLGGYNSSSPLFAINHDGSDVSGFPYDLSEKVKAGVALADMNENGIDDIIFGADDDNLYVLLDDLTIAPGFPIDLGNNIQSEPSVLDVNGEKIILTGCKNDNFYAINYNDASIRFVIPTGDDVFTSAAYYEGQNGLNIYFGSDDGNVYGLDVNGNALDGFPINISGGVVGSIVVSDLDNNGIVDLVAANSLGQLHAFDIYGAPLAHFPIYHEFPFASSPLIVDFDLDNDLEIVCGSTGDVVMVDVKNQDGDNSYWSMYKGGERRSGLYISGNESFCTSGDINADSIVNILDIVRLVNIVIDPTIMLPEEECAADLNSDGIINILDIVTLVNIVISNG